MIPFIGVECRITPSGARPIGLQVVSIFAAGAYHVVADVQLASGTVQRQCTDFAFTQRSQSVESARAGWDTHIKM